MQITETDLSLLRRSFAVAARSRQHGNLPFASVLADADGAVLIEAENSVVTAGDRLGHAEMNLVRLASSTYSSPLLQACTVYASSEPCPMCAAALYWIGIRRIVYGLSTNEKNKLTVHNNQMPGLGMSCREILRTANHPVEVYGPLLEQEALQPHTDFW